MVVEEPTGFEYLLLAVEEPTGFEYLWLAVEEPVPEVHSRQMSVIAETS